MNIWILALEQVETRYTGQWYKNIPDQLINLLKSKKNINNMQISPNDDIVNLSNSSDIINIITVNGIIDNNETTPGAFLNFASTNIWKSSQLELLSKYFSKNKINNGDQFLVTDAWNPAILQLKYMIDLLGLNQCKIHAVWHAGQYDPQDFLGRCLPEKRWALHTEQALFHAIDHNYFATNFHLELFKENVFSGFLDTYKHFYSKKIVISGQPHELLVDQLNKHHKSRKTNSIVFPHRVAPEKQPEIFRDLSKDLTEYDWIVCQDKKLTKNQYHEIMIKSKIMFSCSLQETLGIGAMEAILVGTIPLIPDRLSYSEMYLDFFKYPSEWTVSWDNYLKHKEDIKELIKHKIDIFYLEETDKIINEQKEILLKNYLQADKMYNIIMENLLRSSK